MHWCIQLFVYLLFVSQSCGLLYFKSTDETEYITLISRCASESLKLYQRHSLLGMAVYGEILLKPVIWDGDMHGLSLVSELLCKIDIQNLNSWLFAQFKQLCNANQLQVWSFGAKVFQGFSTGTLRCESPKLRISKMCTSCQWYSLVFARKAAFPVYNKLL